MYNHVFVLFDIIYLFHECKPCRLENFHKFHKFIQFSQYPRIQQAKRIVEIK